jgi:anti-sigma-K factor RskA
MDRQELLDLIPAYALGALDYDERTEVEALLNTDHEARRLLEEYQAMTEAMAVMTPARRAPAYLQDDLRQRLQAGRNELSTLQVTAPPRRFKPMIWIPVAAAAALVVIVGALLLWQGSMGNSPERLYGQLVAQADARRIPIQAGQDVNGQPFQASGELVISADGQQAVIRVENLPVIESDQTFQLWLVETQTPDTPQSGGLFRFADPKAANYILLPLVKPASAYAAVGLSLEPAGGSTAPVGPSGPRVFGVALSQ